MKELLQVRGLGLAGLNSDAPEWDLPNNYITKGINFRTQTGQIVSSGGWEEWSTPPSSFNAGFMLYNITDDDDNWIVAGSSAVYSVDASSLVWTDISNTSGYFDVVDPTQWNGCNLANIAILNQNEHTPEYFNSTSGLMEYLPFDATDTWNDKDHHCKVIRTHKNFLLALNLTENGVVYEDGYRWSHPADINGLPFTWDETDVSSIASRENIGGDSGGIIDGLSLRDSFVIYSENGINILDFTGDDYVFKKRELSTSAGLLSRDCVVEVKGVHYFLSDGDVFSNNGTTVDSVMHDKIRKLLVSSVDNNNFHNSFAIKNEIGKEIYRQEMNRAKDRLRTLGR